MGMIYHKKRMWKKLNEKESSEKENSNADYRVEERNEEIEKHQNGQILYTKTDINKMSTSQLQSLAAESGIEDAEQKNGGELKKLLIEKFSL